MFDAIQSRLDGNDRAVSPVIGVVLMVAITVILAAVIGSFVLSFGDEVTASAPQAQLSIADTTVENVTANGTQQTNLTVTMSQDGGDEIDLATTDIVVQNAGETTRFNDEDSNTSAVIQTADTFDITVNNRTGNNQASDIVVAGGVTVWNDIDDRDDEISQIESDELDNSGDGEGDRVTITIVDTESGEIIFERTITI